MWNDLKLLVGLPFRCASLSVTGFIEHGLAKLSRGPDGFARTLQQLGVPPPRIAAWLTIGTELVGYELDLLYFAALLILSFQGLGPLSVDESGPKIAA